MAVGFLAGCASVSNFQTARTVAQGKYEVLLGTSYFESQDYSEAASYQTGLTPAKESNPEMGIRTGVLERMDVGAKFLGKGITIDAKHMLIDKKSFHAHSPGVFYSEYLPNVAGHSSGLHMRDFGFAFHNSLHYDEWIAAYLTPKYAFRNISGTVPGNAHLLYAAFGLKVGSDVGGYAEFVTGKSITTRYQHRQFGVGFFLLK